MSALALGRRLRRIVDIVRDSLPNKDCVCSGCDKALKEMPPFSVICSDCRDILAVGIIAAKPMFPDGIVLPCGFEVILVTAKPDACAMAKGLMEKDMASRRVLARAYAHAVPVSEYMLTDGAYMKHEGAGGAASNLRAFTREIASAFSVDYKGALQGETENWQEANLARYTKGTGRKAPATLYPVVAVESADTKMLESLASNLASKGSERMIVIVSD